jgi:hypothetical protein
MQQDRKCPQSKALVSRSGNHSNEGRLVILGTKLPIVTEATTAAIETLVTLVTTATIETLVTVNHRNCRNAGNSGNHRNCRSASNSGNHRNYRNAGNSEPPQL